MNNETIYTIYKILLLALLLPESSSLSSSHFLRAPTIASGIPG
ncbi:149_t:CDS:1, partial [Racocetra persica]